ncbi:L30e-like protein [Xylaria venustula]|nr:L30e-like protein [Xylaria venustula]
MGPTKPEKKEKKEKKRSDADGVGKVKKDKKDKKEKEKLKSAVSAALDGQDDAPVAVTVEEKTTTTTTTIAPVVGALVPFARPLADDKATKKVMKSVRKGMETPIFLIVYSHYPVPRAPRASQPARELLANSYFPTTAAKNKTLKRGVKEVVKSLRKSPAAGPNNTSFPGVVVLAGDISPMDVISHIPVLCEDVNVPYIFVASRAELGAAGSTKRPTSVVMVTEKRVGGAAKKGGDKIDEEEGEEDFADVYKDLVKLVEKESKAQLKMIV